MRPRLACPNCGHDVEALPFCGACGRRLTVPGQQRPVGPTPPVGPGPLPGLRRLVGLREARGRLAAMRRGRGDLARLVAAAGAGLVLVLLLADLAGLAIAVAVAVLPTLTVAYLTHQDVYEREPWPLLVAVGAAGFVAGVLVSLLNSALVQELWLGETVFNIGNAGFAGPERIGEGTVPLNLLVLVGLLTPLLAVGAQLVGPLALRRWPAYRNEVMDGVTLGAAAGGGFATASAVVYYWPFITGGDSRGDAGDWTATLIGLVLVRPLILAATAAMVGAGVWRYAMTLRSRDLLVPLLAGLGGAVVYPVGVLAVIPAGTTVELVWGIVALAGVGVLFRRVVAAAQVYDQRVAMGGGGRVVCPACRRVTPSGEFCAHCGRPLAGQTVIPAPSENAAPVAEPDAPPGG